MHNVQKIGVSSENSQKPPGSTLQSKSKWKAYVWEVKQTTEAALK